jgi:hypothetical protein
VSSFDWKGVERDKAAFHERSAGGSFSEKLSKLDRLRERSAALKPAAARAKVSTAKPASTASVRKKK